MPGRPPIPAMVPRAPIPAMLAMLAIAAMLAGEGKPAPADIGILAMLGTTPPALAAMLPACFCCCWLPPEAAVATGFDGADVNAGWVMGLWLRGWLMGDKVLPALEAREGPAGGKPRLETLPGMVEDGVWAGAEAGEDLLAPARAWEREGGWAGWLAEACACNRCCWCCCTCCCC